MKYYIHLRKIAYVLVIVTICSPALAQIPTPPDLPAIPTPPNMTMSNLFNEPLATHDFDMVQGDYTVKVRGNKVVMRSGKRRLMHHPLRKIRRMRMVRIGKIRIAKIRKIRRMRKIRKIRKIRKARIQNMNVDEEK